MSVAMSRRAFLGVAASSVVAGLAAAASASASTAAATAAASSTAVGSATAAASSTADGSAAASAASSAASSCGMSALWDAHKTADRIVVVSDLHFGIDDRFSQDVANREVLVELIDRLIEVGDVRELVIAGDFLDEWIVPLSYPAHDDSDAFYKQCIATNQVVFDALSKAIDAGITVVYVPGNHDMLLSEKVLEKALPGIEQAREADGMGRYITGDRDEIVIEHCHRYDVYSAPDAVSNRELAGNDDTLLPPGYFYARLGTEWVAEGKPTNVVDYPKDVEMPASTDIDQLGAYLHYKIITGILLTQYTPDVDFDEKIFEMHIAGFDDTYSEYDLCPRQMEDGTISAPTLYRNFQRTWDERQDDNLVNVKIPFIEAASGTSQAPYFRGQASTQYLDDQKSGIEVVAFGHTHIPDFHDFGDGRFYVNSGTWIDDNLDADVTRTFAVITTGKTDSVELYAYGDKGELVDITAKSTDAGSEVAGSVDSSTDAGLADTATDAAASAADAAAGSKDAASMSSSVA